MALDTRRKRILELDYMRGFALLGIMLTNIITIFHLPIPINHEQANYLKFLDFFIESKFFTIFSFLFGMGFYIFIRNSKAKELNSTIVFIRRLVILAGFGIVHQLLQPGEALLLYSIMGLLLIPSYYLNKYINLSVGLIFLGLCLYIGNKTLLPIPYFILGLTAGQFNIFDNVKNKVLVVLMSVSGLLSLASWIMLSKFYVFPNYKFIDGALSKEVINNFIQDKAIYEHLIIITSPFIALFYISLLLLSVRVQILRRILYPLQLYGRMALTNYIGQTLLIYLAILLIGNGRIDYIDTLWICITVYIFQLIFSAWWLKYFEYGPLEYIWRLGTYWKLFSIIKK
ncbi:DUF418 domain-containing protein [Staphylococcus succinus]|nr:DUF418 domain-containing protein [Staphylococcus succinus]RIN39412.1 DUF418 domain-containing protein [Staphylococcus succinus]